MILIPIGHDEQKVQRLPWITYTLIGLNALIFLYTFLNAPTAADFNKPLSDAIEYYAMHPYLELPEELKKLFSEEQLKQLENLKEDPPDISKQELAREQRELDQKVELVLEVLHKDASYRYGHYPTKPVWWGYFSSMFLHGDLFHLLGNMLFLYLVGCSLEDAWGRPLYISFYLSSGIIATLAHDLRFYNSSIPLIGASGAIAGLMGAFLVRFYKTNIKFFYLIGIWIRGKFSAPAWVVLPVWLFLQMILDKAAGGQSGVAFVAHIGGFVYGAIFGIIMNVTRFEEKFVAPYIEGKVSILQNPDFLKAIECFQKMDYVQAKALLHKTIQQEPDHVEAYMELQKLAEATDNQELQLQATAGLLEVLARKKEADLVLENYHHFNRNRPRESDPLPAKTLMALGIFFEQIPDYRTSMEIYEELARVHSQDPLGAKALARSARIHLDRIDQRNAGAELLKQSYLHQAADDAWRSILKSDFLKFQIPVPQVPAPARASTRHAEQRPTVEIPKPGPRPPVPQMLPDSAFEDNAGIIFCWIEGVEKQGLLLRNEKQVVGLLTWDRLRFFSVGRVKDVSAPATQPHRDYLIVDIVPEGTSLEGGRMIYRTFSYRLDFKKLQPGAASSGEAYKGIINKILQFSGGATCIPDAGSCTGPEFRIFNSPAEYEAHLNEYLSYAE